MTTAICTTAPRTIGNRTLRVFMSFLVLFMTAVLFTGCKKGVASMKEEEYEESEWKKGVASMKEEEYEEAVKQFKESAGKGNTDARMMLALCYLTGMGVDQDAKKAEKQLRNAVKSGDPVAQAAYGIILLIQLEQGREYDEEDLEEAIKYLKKSADQDCVFGQLALGMTYLFSGNEDSEKGIKLLKKVAARPKSGKKIFLDDVKACVWDYLVETQFSDISDKEEAELIRAVSKALESDELTVLDIVTIMSQSVLFTYYAEEEKDYDEAEKWLNKAKKSGLPQKIHTMAKEELDNKRSRSTRYRNYDDYDW